MGFECPTLVLKITDRNHEATRTRTKMHPRWSGRGAALSQQEQKSETNWSNPSKQELHVKPENLA